MMTYEEKAIEFTKKIALKFEQGLGRYPQPGEMFLVGLIAGLIVSNNNLTENIKKLEEELKNANTEV